MTLRNVIDQVNVPPEDCAETFGVSESIFSEWLSGSKKIPDGFTEMMAATFGVKPEDLHGRPVSSRGERKPSSPAIWFKFKGLEFSAADRECILLIRRLGHNANQLEKATTGLLNREWEVVFDIVRSSVDFQASPEEQGRTAARMFSELRQFGHHSKGVGEILRSNLRALGILVIESPVHGSRIEGCSFFVGDAASQRPCVFANNYQSSWFRRNVTLMHEVGHAIFDRNDGGKVDLQDALDSFNAGRDPVSEIRAQTFAKESLVPKKLLISLFARLGLKPALLDASGIALLMAETGVEKKTLVEVLLDYGLIDEPTAEKYSDYETSASLRQISDHALSTKEYIDKIGMDTANKWLNKRFTLDGKAKLLLPAPYVKAVLDAVKLFAISIGKASELLMIDTYTFEERFPEYCEAGIE
jgi:Zn-dependent peptidase ImmA (M78 family)